MTSFLPGELEEVRAGRDRLSSVASVSIEEQLEFLEEKLSVLQSSQNVAGASRRAREKALRRELTNLRRQLRLERKAMGSGRQTYRGTRRISLGRGGCLLWGIPLPLEVC